MKKSQIVAALLADIEKNGDTYVSDKILAALDSRPWIRREAVTLIKYFAVLAILAGILK